MNAYAMMNALMLPGLTDLQGKVYAYLIFRANGARVCWPSVATIAADLHISERRVSLATQKLVELGRIEIVRRHKDTHNYRIVDVPGLHEQPTRHERQRLSWDDDSMRASPTQTQVSDPDHPTQTHDQEATKTHVNEATWPDANAPCGPTQTTVRDGFDPTQTHEESIQQGRKNNKEGEQEESLAATVPGNAAGAHARDASLGKEKEVPSDWGWSMALKRYVPPPEQAPRRFRNPFIEAMSAMGSPGANGEESIHGFDVQVTTTIACQEACLNPHQGSYDQARAVRTWLREGIEPSQIRRAISRCTERAGYQPPLSLGWFDKPVRAEFAKQAARRGARR